jgi:hypothetical protein
MGVAVLEQREKPLNREEVETHFEAELSKRSAESELKATSSRRLALCGDACISLLILYGLHTAASKSKPAALGRSVVLPTTLNTACDMTNIDRARNCCPASTQRLAQISPDH